MYSFRNITELRNDLLRGVVSCTRLVEESIAEIESKKNLNIFLEVFRQSALAKAGEIDLKIKAGVGGELAGVIIAIKDNICYEGHRCSAASKILEDFTSLYSATAVQRLLDADAIIIGRTNCDEFAMGSSTENSAFGNVLNPLNERMVPGGSSGGSAAAVAAGLCHAALGSDTGGSIRQPASFCGIVGMKPSYGSVSRWGLIAYASSFDQIGTLTKSVDDSRKILQVIAGRDEYDSTLSQRPVPDYSGKNIHRDKKIKIACLKPCFENPGLDAEIKSGVESKLKEFEKLGHSVTYVDFPYLEYLVPTYYVLTTAEASSNLSRFSGTFYGYRSPNAHDLESTFKMSRSEGFGEEVKRRIMLGTFVLSSGYYDAYYSKAQKVRRMVRDFTTELLKKYDCILTPTTPGTAFEFGKNNQDPISMYLEDIFTVQAPIAGIPAISIPGGVAANKLPYGIQIMVSPFCEAEMFSIAETTAALP